MVIGPHTNPRFRIKVMRSIIVFGIASSLFSHSFAENSTKETFSKSMRISAEAALNNGSVDIDVRVYLDDGFYTHLGNATKENPIAFEQSEQSKSLVKCTSDSEIQETPFGDFGIYRKCIDFTATLTPGSPQALRTKVLIGSVELPICDGSKSWFIKKRFAVLIEEDDNGGENKATRTTDGSIRHPKKD